MILKGYIFSILYVLVCVLGAVLLSKVGVPKKFTRKFVHILVGFEWLILYHYMGAGSPHFLAVCLLFLVLLTVDYKAKLLPAMSSDTDNAPGTVYYAVAMSIMATVTIYVPEMILPFGIGVFCTSFGDGLAGVVGQAVKKHNPKIWGNKTLFGSITNLISCFVIPLIFDAIYGMGLSVWQCFMIALFAFEIELFIGYGLDNIAITLGCAALSHAIIYIPDAVNYLVPILVTPLIIAFAYKKRALTLDGIFAAIFMDIAISVSLGNFGFTVLITFFVGSIAIDKLKKHYKKSRRKIEIDREKRGDCRDVTQVLANGFVSTVAALCYFITENQLFVFAFVAALAEAFADTAASGVGFMAKRVYDIFRFERCENGISGGMSLIGTVAGFVAALLASLVAFAFGAVTFVQTLLITAAAFLGSVFDSLLGSLFQVKYKCKVCSQIIEREQHCGAITERYRGFAFINNDVVNFLSTAFSAALAAFLCFLIL